MTPNELPLLRFTPDQGDDALLGYKLTEQERTIFKEMDSATAALPEDSSVERYHEVVIPIGAKHGLIARQAVTFWTRATFSMFERS